MESIGIAVLAFLLCCINLVLWLIFLRKFNRFFSTEKIIQNTRLEVENIMRDLNRATDRDMTIIEARLKEIKAAWAEAERTTAAQECFSLSEQSFSTKTEMNFCRREAIFQK